MSSNHGYGKFKKNAMLRKWDKNNIFGDEDVDMFGITIDQKNFESVHHIFDRHMQCVGVASLSRYIHDYLDFHLKFQDKEEYFAWNEYLKDVYDYINNCPRMISLYELKAMRYELLKTLNTNQMDKYSGKYKLKYLKTKAKLKPYLAEYNDKIGNIPIISDYRIILKNDLPVDASLEAFAWKKYYDNKIMDYEMNLDYVSSLNSLKYNDFSVDTSLASSTLRRIMEERKRIYKMVFNGINHFNPYISREYPIGKVKLNKNKELSGIISQYCNTDALGLNMGYMTDIDTDIEKLFGEGVFLYERSIDILNFVENNDQELYDEWLSLFATYPNRDDDYEEKAYDLRKKTHLLLKKKAEKNDKNQHKNMFRLKKSLRQNNYISRQA